MAVLPDVLEENLKVVFCGTAAGVKSAQLGLYYAGKGNRFWSVLFRIGLTSRQLTPKDFRLLPAFGLGLTDIEKNQSVRDERISFSTSDRECQ